MPISSPVTSVGTPFSCYATTTGNPNTGDFDAIGDYSGAPQNFWVEPQQGQQGLQVTRLLTQIEDAGNFQADSYGNGIVLVNGITISVLDINDNVTNLLTARDTIKANVHWARYCYDVDFRSFGSGNNFLDVRWTFSATGKPIQLMPGEKLVLTLNDDFSDLVAHYFVMQGLTLP